MRQRYIAILGLCSLGCTVSTQLEDGPPTLRIAGSNTIVEQLLPPLTQTHVNTRKTIRFSLQADGNSNGIRQLLKREVDLAATTREYTSGPVSWARQSARID